MTNKINPWFLLLDKSMRAQNSLVFQKARNKFIAGISIPHKLDIFFDITLFRNITSMNGIYITTEIHILIYSTEYIKVMYVVCRHITYYIYILYVYNQLLETKRYLLNIFRWYVYLRLFELIMNAMRKAYPLVREKRSKKYQLQCFLNIFYVSFITYKSSKKNLTRNSNTVYLYLQIFIPFSK